MTTRCPLPLRLRRCAPGKSLHRQRGVVAIEFALVFLFGLLPLLLLTLSGVLIFAAKQSLTLAAAEGARAALHYGTPAERGVYACQAARHSMQWLLAYSGESSSCAAAGIGAAISVSTPAPCDSTPAVQCITVNTSFDYNAHPFVPGTATLYQWLMDDAIRSSATVQLDTQGS